MRTCVVLLTALAVSATPAAWGQLGSMDLLSALESGHVRGAFFGNGESSVRAYLERDEFGPGEVTVEPGTQFFAQFGGGGGGRGRTQGMGALGQTNIDFSDRSFASVDIPTVCTDIGLPAPTVADAMIPTAPPDVWMAQLLALPALTEAPHGAFQIAAWAIANNPPGPAVQGLAAQWVRQAAQGELTAEETRTRVSELFIQAQALLRLAGCEPAAFRLFQAPAQ